MTWTVPALVIALVGLLGLIVVTNRIQTIIGSPVVDGAYAPQWSRNAEIDGPAQGSSFTPQQIQAIVDNNSYESFPKFSHGYDISAHFADARRFVDASAADGHHIRILEYFNVTFWVDAQLAGWQPYTDSFDSSWLLRDSTGQVVPFYGTKRSAHQGDTPTGAVLDLRNPALRAWVVQTIVAWMKAAPYSGIHLDSANPLLGDTVRRAVGNGHETWNQLLCGNDSERDFAGNCVAVAEWNDGLVDLVNAVRAALAPSGYEVDFNGIAPNEHHGASRNLTMLSHADVANDEDFCYHAASNGSKITFSPMLSDIAILQHAAAQDKRIFDITNFQTDEYRKYGSYCLAGFLMGWEPDHGYWVYHRNYSDPLADDYPYLPEQNLNLGNPEGPYSHQGTLLTRTFQHGVVAVNLGRSPVTFTAPADIAQFAGGAQQRWLSAGEKITLGGLTGAFFLSRSFLDSLAR